MNTQKNNIQTPAILLDLDALENNIKNFHQLAADGNKKLWPMIKTHKSTEIAHMQLDHGATGFLCGTLDECETIYENLVHGERRNINIMYAYPVAGYPNLSRVIKLAKDCKSFYLRLDDYRQCQLLNQAAAEAGVSVNYTVIINTGLNRFGIAPWEIEELMCKTASLKYLNFCGISTHPGHVYSQTTSDGIAKIAQQESDMMQNTANTLGSMGITPQLISSGSTPTYHQSAKGTVINCLHPGNYVFMDNMQISMGCAMEEDCALTVLTTVLSAPRDGEFIIDAGSKCLGLDKGGHGNEKIKGYGRIKNQKSIISAAHSNDGLLTVQALSEEVGKIVVSEKYHGKVNLKIGDKLEIIPNHSCAAANNTSYYIAVRQGIFDRLISVDMRGNSTTKGMGSNNNARNGQKGGS